MTLWHLELGVRSFTFKLLVDVFFSTYLNKKRGTTTMQAQTHTVNCDKRDRERDAA